MIPSIILMWSIAFVVTLITTKYLIKYLKKIDLVVKDMNKKNTPLVPVSGGISVFIGIAASFMIFIFLQTFFVKNNVELSINIFAATTSLFIITFIGFIDDIIINKSKESSIGLKQWQKPLLTLFAAIPLMVVDAGTTTMTIPFLGLVNLGILYPLLVIPVGVVGASNMVNMLAGFNGLEVGLGIISTGMLGIYSILHNSFLGAILSFTAMGGLLAFYFYNKTPAKILPGDSLTYLIGGMLAIIAILGNIERAALLVSIPFFIEFILKARTKFKAQTYGYYKDGKIQSRYEKIYSLPHFMTRTGKYTEKQIVYAVMFFELLISSLIFLIH